MAEAARTLLAALTPEQRAAAVFGWSDPLRLDYRVQGPTFLIEYDNTQNDANHIHTLWRDLRNDFGEDALRRHYQETPHPDSQSARPPAASSP
jgi:hypothetical protein